MERFIEVLLREASAAIPPLAACGCDECLRARRSGVTEGACRGQLARLEGYVATRLRRASPRGAAAHARLVEEARRYARLQAALAPTLLVARMQASSLERRLDAFSIECPS